jgi:hypothetical protein
MKVKGIRREVRRLFQKIIPRKRIIDIDFEIKGA